MAGGPPTKDAPPFGRRLSALRKSRGLSQRELAARLETTREIIDYCERRSIDFNTFENDEEVMDAVIHNLTVIGEAPRKRPVVARTQKQGQ